MVHIVVFILTQNMFNNLYICEYSCMSKTLCNSNEVLNKVCERIDDEWKNKHFTLWIQSYNKHMKIRDHVLFDYINSPKNLVCLLIIYGIRQKEIFYRWLQVFKMSDLKYYDLSICLW